MAKNVKKFVNREFVRTVDLDLLKRLLDPYSRDIALDWTALPADEKQKREAIFEFFRGADERFPAQLLDALHRIMVLSDANGARLLQEQAELNRRHAGAQGGDRRRGRRSPPDTTPPRPTSVS